MHVLPTMVFETLHDPNLIALCQGKKDPTDADWEIYFRAVEAMSTASPLLVLVVSEGGHPSPAQRQKIFAFTRRRRPKVAIVTSATGIRFVLSIFALVNPNIRSFLPSQLASGLEYLGLTPTQVIAVSELVDRMREKLRKPSHKVA